MKNKILIVTLMLFAVFGFTLKLNATTVGQGTINASTFIKTQDNIAITSNNRINGQMTYSKLINTQGFSFVDYFRIYRDKSINRIGFNFYINYEDSEGENDFGFLVYPGANVYDAGAVVADFIIKFKYADGSSFETNLIDYSDEIVSDYHAYNKYPYKALNYVEVTIQIAFQNFGEGLDILAINEIYLDEGIYYPNIMNYEMILTNPNINSMITEYALIDNGATNADIRYTVTLPEPTHLGVLYHTNPNLYATDDRANSTITFNYDNETSLTTTFLEWESRDNCSLLSSTYCQQIINFDLLPGSPVVESITFNMRQKERYSTYLSRPTYTSQLFSYMSEIIVSFTPAPHRVFFYVDTELYYSINYNDTFVLPPNPPDQGYLYFMYWAYVDGKPYNNVEIDPFYYVDDKVNLYAKFKPLPSTTPIPENPTGVLDNGFGEILNTFKLNNVQGLRIVYVVVALVLLFAGIIFFKNVVLIALLEIAWLGLAMFMGIVDLWIVIIIGLVTALVIKLKVGD